MIFSGYLDFQQATFEGPNKVETQHLNGSIFWNPKGLLKARPWTSKKLPSQMFLTRYVSFWCSKYGSFGGKLLNVSLEGGYCTEPCFKIIPFTMDSKSPKFHLTKWGAILQVDSAETFWSSEIFSMETKSSNFHATHKRRKKNIRLSLTLPAFCSIFLGLPFIHGPSWGGVGEGSDFFVGSQESSFGLPKNPIVLFTSESLTENGRSLENGPFFGQTSENTFML